MCPHNRVDTPRQVKNSIMSVAELDNYKQAADNRDLKHIPGSFGLPVIGHFFEMVTDLYGTIDRQYCRYGPVSRLGVAYLKGVLLIGPDLYGEVYLDKDKNFSAEMGYARTLGRFYKGALLLRDHGEHRFQRRIMQSAFKTEAMRGYFGTMGPMLKEAVEGWDGREDFLFFPAIKQALLDVAATIFVGLDKDDDRAANLNHAFLDIANGLLGFFAKEIPGTKYARGKKAQRHLQEFFGSLIEERRRGKGIDTFSYFTRETTEDGEYFSDEDIIAHIVARLCPDPSTLEMPLDELAAETRREDSTSSFTTAHEVVSVMVVAASLGFAQRINVAFGTGRVAPWVVSTELELADGLEGTPPPIVIVDASDIPAIPQRALMQKLTALPSTTACVVWGRELPYGRSLTQAAEASGRAWITLEKKEGIAPLLDLVRSRRKGR